MFLDHSKRQIANTFTYSHARNYKYVKLSVRKSERKRPLGKPILHTQIIRKHFVNLSLYDEIKLTEDTNILYYSSLKNKNLIYFFRRLKVASISNWIIQPIYFYNVFTISFYNNVSSEVTDKSAGFVVSNVIMSKVA